VLYLLDSNAISDYLAGLPDTIQQVTTLNAAGESLGLCRPVHYEVLRGLLWRDAAVKLEKFNRLIGIMFVWVELENSDWQQAAEFYASTRSAGKQLADTDLLVAAMALRLDAMLVSSDTDFDVLPIKRISWRKT